MVLPLYCPLVTLTAGVAMGDPWDGPEPLGYSRWNRDVDKVLAMADTFTFDHVPKELPPRCVP